MFWKVIIIITVATIIKSELIENSLCLKVKVLRDFLLKELIFLKSKSTHEYIPVSINTVIPHKDYSDYDALLKGNIGIIDLKENFTTLNDFENYIYINMQTPIEDKPVREDFDITNGNLYLPPVVNVKNSTTRKDFLKYISKEEIYILYNYNACYCQLKPIIHSSGKLYLSFLFKKTIDSIDIVKYLEDYDEQWKNWDASKIEKELKLPIEWIESCIKSYDSTFIAKKLEKGSTNIYEFYWGTVTTEISKEHGYSSINITYIDAINLTIKENLGEFEISNIVKVNKNTTVNEFFNTICIENLYKPNLNSTYVHYKLHSIKYNCRLLSIDFEFNFNQLSKIFISIDNKIDDLNVAIENLIFINNWLLKNLSIDSSLLQEEKITEDTIFTYNLSFGTIISQLDENNVATVEINYFISTLDIDKRSSLYSVFK